MQADDTAVRCVSVATGEAAYPELLSLAKRLEAKFPLLKIHVYCIKNHFFGQHITVAGLLTGRDIADGLAGKELGERLFLPRAALREEGDLFLCGMTPAELSQKLEVPVRAVKGNGASLLAAFLGCE